MDYESARFVSVVAEFFDQDCYTGLSLGIQNGPTSVHELGHYNQGDNGVYLVCRAGEERKVRRFSMHHHPKGDGTYGQEWREFAPGDVAREQVEAETHKYNNSTDGIPSIFTKMNESEHYQKQKEEREKASAEVSS